MKYVWGLFSVPFYQRDLGAMKATFDEVNRVLEPGGYARFYPLRESQLSVAKEWATNRLGFEPKIKQTGNFGFFHTKGYLMTWQKPQ
jgi:hypothetical protein